MNYPIVRTITYRIPLGEQYNRIYDFLQKKGYSYQNIVDLRKELENVQRNGKPTYLNQGLQEGDILTVHIRERKVNEKITPVDMAIDVVYEDEDIIVINKSAGMPIHPSMRHGEDSLANALSWYFLQKKRPFVFRCMNRLDKDTSGLTVVAKHSLSASILSSNIANEKGKEIQREYLAIVEGRLIEKAGRIEAPIARESESCIKRTVDFERGDYAVTKYEVVEEKEHSSLIKLQLETGRTHQIRVHMSYIGHPLLGDFLYNPNNKEQVRQALHGYHIKFQHPITKKEMEFFSSLPKDLIW